MAASGRAVAALVALLALAAVATTLLVWLTRPQATALPVVTRSGGVAVGAAAQGRAVSPTAAAAGGFPAVDSPTASAASASPVGRVVVHVAGAVRHPGLVTLPAGSRVDDAVDAAGGPTSHAQIASVNLARLLVDGEQLVVLRRGQVGPPVSAPGAPAAGSAAAGEAAPGGASSGPIDLNAATLEQLDGLPGIGPVLAQRILDWRTAHGRFGSVDELSEVSGIGERTLADLRPEVRV